MGKRNIKNWVIPALGLFVVVGSFFCFYLINNLINYSVAPNDDTHVTNTLIDNTAPVNETVEETDSENKTVIKPYTSENVSISKYFYNTNDDESRQQTSLIKYQNIYMPNTGILYSSDETFDIVAILNGKVTNIKEDDILGNIIEIEHDNNIVSIYQSVKDIKVSIGDNVNQGDVIATSGSNKLEGEKENCLHFEVYKEGNLINPEEYLNS